MKKYRLVLFLVITVMVLLPAFLLFAGGKKAKEEPVLSILCFAEAYAIDEWVYPFEEMYDCKVNRTYAGTVEEHYSKTKAAPDQYNIVSIMSSRVRMYYDDGLIREIPVDKLSNWGELNAFFREGLVETIEPGKEFYVPIAWGNQDFIVNTKVVGDKLKRPA
jgi:spermidine/putrescine-binding protein